MRLVVKRAVYILSGDGGAECCAHCFISVIAKVGEKGKAFTSFLGSLAVHPC